MDRLLDEGRSGPTFLRQPAIAQVVVASLRCVVELGHYQLHAWVIMPNHVHLLLTPEEHEWSGAWRPESRGPRARPTAVKSQLAGA